MHWYRHLQNCSLEKSVIGKFFIKPGLHLNEVRSFSGAPRRGRTARTGLPIWAASLRLGIPLNLVYTGTRQHRGEAFSAASFKCGPGFREIGFRKISFGILGYFFGISIVFG